MALPVENALIWLPAANAQVHGMQKMEATRSLPIIIVFLPKLGSRPVNHNLLCIHSILEESI